MSLGDILTVLSGIPCAMNIVISSLVCREKNVLLLTTIELCYVTLFAWIYVFISNGYYIMSKPKKSTEIKKNVVEFI